MTSTNPFFAPVTELPRHEAMRVLRDSKQDVHMPVDLSELCEWAAFRLEFRPISEKNVGACARQTEGEWWIEVDSTGSDSHEDFSTIDTVRRRQRFGVAHELGHLTYKSHCDVILQNQLLTGENPHSRSYLLQKEAQANEFAVELLLPYRIIQKSLSSLDFEKDFFSSVESVCTEFDTSLTATVKRIATLLDFPVIAIHFAPDGQSHQTPSYSPEFKYSGFYFPKHGSIPFGTFARDMFDRRTNTEKGKKQFTDTTDWFPDSNKQGYHLVEWSLNLGKFGILTFLELIEEDDY